VALAITVADVLGIGVSPPTARAVKVFPTDIWQRVPFGPSGKNPL